MIQIITNQLSDGHTDDSEYGIQDQVMEDKTHGCNEKYEDNMSMEEQDV